MGSRPVSVRVDKVDEGGEFSVGGVVSLTLVFDFGPFLFLRFVSLPAVTGASEGRGVRRSSGEGSRGVVPRLCVCVCVESDFFDEESRRRVCVFSQARGSLKKSERRSTIPV